MAQKIKKQSEQKNDLPDMELTFGLFLFPIIFLIGSCFLLIDYIFIKSGNIPFYIGLLFFAVTIIELKIGVSFNPGSIYSALNIGTIRKAADPNKFKISICAHLIVGAFFIILGIFYALGNRPPLH